MLLGRTSHHQRRRRCCELGAGHRERRRVLTKRASRGRDRDHAVGAIRPDADRGRHVARCIGDGAADLGRGAGVNRKGDTGAPATTLRLLSTAVAVAVIVMLRSQSLAENRVAVTTFGRLVTPPAVR